MTTETPRERKGEDGCPPPPEHDPNCDPKLIDDLTCKASGVAAQAAYNATYQKELDKAKADYDTTRKDYRTKRHDGFLQVQDMRHQIKHLIERIKCLIEQRRVWKCLDDAFCEVLKELKCCKTPEGCCVEECAFNVDDLDELDYAALLKRIADYQLEADGAKACFTALVGEPAALAKRIVAAKSAIDAINAALSADPATTDLKRVYAQALVANRDIERIWGGFDQTHDFVECLCLALTCWTKGVAAVSVLVGAKAVAECRQKAKEDRCTHLRTNTVDEILATYDKLCPKSGPCPEPEKPCPDPDHDDSECDDPGHHHHHHHHHHYHQGHEQDYPGKEAPGA